MEKIAIIADSGSDINLELKERFDIELIPLYVNYKEKSYRDVYDLSAEEMYRRLPEEIPTTSTPSVGDITQRLEELKKRGYHHVIAPTISSGLSGMYNTFNIAKDLVEDMVIEVIDTKNIAIATGFFSIYASVLRKEGASFDTIVKKLKSKISDAKDFIALDSLKYLAHGGRIGKVTASVGQILNMKLIISCDKNGVYYTESKNRGTKRNIQKLCELVRKELDGIKNYYMVICKGGEEEMFRKVKGELKDLYEKAIFHYEGQIAPTLGVHTGPGLVGVGIFKFDSNR